MLLGVCCLAPLASLASTNWLCHSEFKDNSPGPFWTRLFVNRVCSMGKGQDTKQQKQWHPLGQQPAATVPTATVVPGERSPLVLQAGPSARTALHLQPGKSAAPESCPVIPTRKSTHNKPRTFPLRQSQSKLRSSWQRQSHSYCTIY